MKERPNILLIFTDQQRFDCIGAAGHGQVQTPNIDKLADEGVMFENAYCPSPVCAPSRAAIFTGQYPFANGVPRNWMPFSRGRILMTDILAQQGYYNALVGKLHFTPVIKRFGFHYKMLHDSPHDVYSEAELKYSEYIKYLLNGPYKDSDHDRLIKELRESETAAVDDDFFWMGKNVVEEEHHETSWNAREACRFIDNYRHDSPFFLNVSFFGPHHPYAVPEPWGSLYDPDTIQLPETFYHEGNNRPVFAARKAKTRSARLQWGERRYREMAAAYYGYVSMIDQKIGEIVESLRRNNRLDDTLIIFTSDHGDHIGEHGLTGKGDMYDTCAKVPLIIRPPGGSGEPLRVRQVVNNIDLFATICDCSGYDNYDIDHERTESTSLLPLLDGSSASSERPNVTFSIHCPSKQAMIRSDNLVLMGAEVEEGRVYELYDVKTDPNELANLFMMTGWQEVSRELQQQLDEWWDRQKEMSEPL